MKIIWVMFYNIKLVFVVSSLFHTSGITMCLTLYFQKNLQMTEWMEMLNKHWYVA